MLNLEALGDVADDVLTPQVVDVMKGDTEENPEERTLMDVDGDESL